MHVDQEGLTRNEVDITMCPSPALNYTSLLEVGSTYRSVIHRLEGQLFAANLTAPSGIAGVFAQMIGCLQDSQFMKSTVDILERIDLAAEVGCMPPKASELAVNHTGSHDARMFLRNLVMEHSYRLLRRHFERKDSLSLYYSDETFKGIEYLKWDNLTLMDFLERISINPARIIKLRPRHNESWSVTQIHTRRAPSCLRYRMRLEPDEDEDSQRLYRCTFDIQR